jgi:hypothetical protein
MKKPIVVLCMAVAGTLSTSAFALPSSCDTTTQKGSSKPGVFLGVTYAFGTKDGLGFSFQVTSSRRDDRAVAAAGVSYYPTTGNVGIPLSLGYQKSDALIMGGYDFLLKAPVVQGGFTNTSKSRTVIGACPT